MRDDSVISIRLQIIWKIASILYMFFHEHQTYNVTALSGREAETTLEPATPSSGHVCGVLQPCGATLKGIPVACCEEVLFHVLSWTAKNNLTPFQ